MLLQKQLEENQRQNRLGKSDQKRRSVPRTGTDEYAALDLLYSDRDVLQMAVQKNSSYKDTLKVQKHLNNDHPCKTAKYKCDECKKKEISPIPKDVLVKVQSNGLEAITMKNNKQISIKDLINESPLKSSRHRDRKKNMSIMTINDVNETFDDLDATMTPRNM